MKQAWLVAAVLAVIMALGLATKVEAEEPAEKVAEVFMIDGYLPDQFSVKGVVEEKLNELVSRLQGIKLEQNSRLLISVTGSADASGKLFANDKLALERAEQVAAVLSSRFPNAVVKSWSAGDDENNRKVKVIFTVEKAEVVKEVQSNFETSKVILILMFIGVFVFIITSAVLILRVLRAQQPQLKSQPQVIQEKKSVEILEVDGYVVPIEHRDGFYWSPFVSKNGNPIRRESFADIKRSLKGCLSDSEFATQKEKLIQEGIIKIKKGGE